MKGGSTKSEGGNGAKKGVGHVKIGEIEVVVAQPKKKVVTAHSSEGNQGLEKMDCEPTMDKEKAAIAKKQEGD
ncbi:hypothetical protein E2562_001924 [Oryza meyeriana var. granulata]|uniref:Uncharacterized protein n=1 Tax=Oryza meyeriana var. granulata TaxID=110450 RepID=A0A6G1C2E9_9ORYZ|nr:hypothetical protein E2562_001924 [Oryza meyeriana var. granulata]